MVSISFKIKLPKYAWRNKFRKLFLYNIEHMKQKKVHIKAIERWARIKESEQDFKSSVL